jgi:heat shock protein HtpX
VSAGLLTATTPAELEAVLAHEISHVRNRDVVVQTSVVVVAATLLELSRVGGWLSRALLFVLGPLASAFVHLMLSPKREFLADESAAAICGSPHPMADASCGSSRRPSSCRSPAARRRSLSTRSIRS